MQLAQQTINLPKGIATGIACLLGYNILAAAKDVVIGQQASQYNPFLMTASVFLIAMLFFQGFVALHRPNALLKPGGKLIDHFMLNVTTAVSWISVYSALATVEPSLVSALIGGLNPIATVVLNKLLRPKSKLLTSDIVGSTVILLVGLSLAWVVVSGNSGLQQTTEKDSIRGLIYAVVAAVTFSGTTVFSKRLHDSGLNSQTVMAHRFYALVFIAVWAAGGLNVFATFFVNNIVLMIAISLFGAIASLFLLQEGTRLCEPMTVELVVAIAPIFTLAFQFFDPRLSVSMHSITANIVLVVAVCVTVYFQMKESK